MEKKQITILIADDTTVAREGLKAILETASDIRIVGETDSVFSIPRLVEQLSPDVLLMDLKWYGDQSVGWIKIREIKEINHKIKIIAQTAYEELIPDARNSGADEVITKSIRREELLDVIRNVAARKVGRQPESPTMSKQDILSPREIEVLRLLDKGLSDKELSNALGIEVNTVKNHVKNILQKLNVPNRRKASIKAREEGLLK